MSAPVKLRPLSAEEASDLRTIARRQKGEARLRDRARICELSREGKSVSEISIAVTASHRTVRRWIHRFNAHGIAGLTDSARIGRPPRYTPEEIGVVIATSLTPPEELGLPYGSWTLDRLAAYVQEEQGLGIKRSRIGELLHAEGLRWRTQETWFGERVDPAFAEKRGRSSPSTRSRP